MADLQRSDPKLSLIMSQLDELNLFPKHPEEILKSKIADFSIRDGILCKISSDEDTPLFLPCIPAKLRLKILKEVHDGIIGHLGFFTTYSLLKSQYYWPNMYTHCHRYVRSCQKCQFFNRRNFVTPGELKPDPPPKVPFQRIGIDFQGPFPVTWPHRNKYIFVATKRRPLNEICRSLAD